jgi:ATP-dependent protease ClpP protease subunit
MASNADKGVGMSLSLEILGHIDDDMFDRVRGQVETECADAIHVRIHSRGGELVPAFGIFHMLVSSHASVTVDIAGVACGAASVIAMAADPGQISMVDGGIFGVMDPWVVADDDVGDLARHAEMLENVRASVAKAYLRHSSLSGLDIECAMSSNGGDGMRYTAAEALRHGFVHRLRRRVRVQHDQCDGASIDAVKHVEHMNAADHALRIGNGKLAAMHELKALEIARRSPSMKASVGSVYDSLVVLMPGYGDFICAPRE